MIFSFGPCRLDTKRLELRREDQVVHVEPQVFDLLLLLIRNRDRTVSKDEILDRIWNGRIVSEAALSSRINAARKAVGDSGSAQALIQTLHKRGFRFVGEVAERDDDGDGPAVAEAAAIEPAAVERAGPGRLPEAPPRADLDPGPGDGRPSVAVMPFENVSRDPRNEYFAYGLTEDVIRLLGRNRWLTVLTRHSARGLRDPEAGVEAVRQALGVRYVVRGSVRTAEDRVRITVELVETRHGRQLWSDAYDFHLANIFDVQDAMAKQIAATIEPEVGSVERDAAIRRSPESLAAWDCYQQGFWHLWGFTVPGFDSAEALFLRAIELDPTLARAHAALAYVRLQAALYREAEERPLLLRAALEGARTAVGLDDRDCLCHCVLGRAHTFLLRYDEGIAALEKCLELNPSFAQGYFALAFTSVWAGREEEALALIERAAELSPRDPHLWTFFQVRGLAHFALGELDGAASFARQALRLPNATYFPQALLVTSLGLMGETIAAGQAAADLMRAKPGYTRSYARADLFYCSDEAFASRYLEGLRLAGIPA